MKDKVKSKAISVKNHVRRNRGKYVALTVTSVFVLVQVRAAKELNSFLTEKGIDPAEYFNPEALEVA